MTSAPVYCVDTSVFLDAYTRHYQPVIFKTFWVKMDELIEDKRIVAPKQVLEELEDIHDDVFAWAKARGHMFVQPDMYQMIEARNIVITFQNLAKQDPRKNYADPFVVALAKSRGHVVVAQELRGSIKDPKIPFICRHFKIPCYTLFEMMKHEGWEF
ncbi:MAG: DUF4411 family protein [Chloroflexota bacterium]|nr:DUF4411 family protein [Chloroflexota bacterium]